MLGAINWICLKDSGRYLLGNGRGANSDFRRILKMFFDRTLVSRPDDGRLVLLWEFRGKLDIQVNFANHAGVRVAFQALDNPYAIGRDATLTAEAKHIDAGAGADGR